MQFGLGLKSAIFYIAKGCKFESLYLALSTLLSKYYFYY